MFSYELRRLSNKKYIFLNNILPKQIEWMIDWITHFIIYWQIEWIKFELEHNAPIQPATEHIIWNRLRTVCLREGSAKQK